MNYDWSEGYVTETSYSNVYFQELNPLRVEFLLTSLGFKRPNIKTACELGFGQGISLNIHSAASNVEWCGNDFNPHHVSFAMSMSEQSGSNVQLSEASFENYSLDNRLPKFDFICLHGIWSWISTKNQSHIVEFIKEKLNPGGIVYVSYNSCHAHAAMIPVREFLLPCFKNLPSHHSLEWRVESALKETINIIKQSPNYSSSYPKILDKLEKMLKLDANYVAHEYLNEDWNPISFTQIVEAMRPAKLDFLTTYDFTKSIGSIHLSEKQQEIISTISDPSARQNALDIFSVNSFRRDLFGKGIKKVNKLETLKLLKSFSFVVSKNLDTFDFKVKGSYAEASLDKELYLLLFDQFKRTAINSFEDLQITLTTSGKNVPLESLVICLQVLTQKGFISPIRQAEISDNTRDRVKKFNRSALDQAKLSKDVTTLACALTEGGLSVRWIDMLLIDALVIRELSVADAVQDILKTLSDRGERLEENGNTLSDEQARVKIDEIVIEFSNKNVQFLRDLQL